MNRLRKFILATISIATLATSSTTSAEQPMAEKYREILESGNFDIEYMPVNIGAKINAGLFSYKYSGIYGEEESKISAYDGKRRFNSKSIVKGKNVHRSAFYQDGKLYDLIKMKMLPESELNSPLLNPKEDWKKIKDLLALPEGLRIFFWEDKFNPNSMNSKPQYKESFKKTIAKKEYDCDRYVADIKSMAGNTLAQEVYDALYQDGSVCLIQKYLFLEGQEFLLNTIQIKSITSRVSEVYLGSKKAIYEASNRGDMNDLLEVPVIAEYIGEEQEKSK